VNTGWDYLTADSDARRLYVSHDQEVLVLDFDTNTVIGKVPGKASTGSQSQKSLGRGLISCTDPGSIVIFDLKTFAVTDRVPVGADTIAIVFDRKTQRIFTPDRGSKRVTALDPKAGKIAGTIEGLGGKTEHAASDDTGHIFLNMQTSTRCSSLTRVTTHPVGVDAAEFDPDRGLAYFSSGDGTMEVFHQDNLDKYTLIKSVKTQTGARTMAIRSEDWESVSVGCRVWYTA